MFTLVEKTVKRNLAKALTSETSATVTESLIAGALAMALCYTARMQRRKVPGVKVTSAYNVSVAIIYLKFLPI